MHVIVIKIPLLKNASVSQCIAPMAQWYVTITNIMFFFSFKQFPYPLSCFLHLTLTSDLLSVFMSLWQARLF